MIDNEVGFLPGTFEEKLKSTEFSHKLGLMFEMHTYEFELKDPKTTESKVEWLNQEIVKLNHQIKNHEKLFPEEYV